MMYEHKTKPVLSPRAFTGRMMQHLGVAILFTTISLGVGIIGFRLFEGYAWLDCILNAAMLLGGMGQISPILTTGGKLFAAAYAIYSGLWVIACTGLILAPVIHRVLHHFHADATNRA
jgi:hypothetical protein